jgi:hypothetical protein
MSEEINVVDRPGRDAADRPAFSVHAMLRESAQLMLGEVYVPHPRQSAKSSHRRQ